MTFQFSRDWHAVLFSDFQDWIYERERESKGRERVDAIFYSDQRKKKKGTWRDKEITTHPLFETLKKSRGGPHHEMGGSTPRDGGVFRFFFFSFEIIFRWVLKKYLINITLLFFYSFGLYMSKKNLIYFNIF